MAAVVDSNALIGLAKGRVFHLLREVFGEVILPDAVWREVVDQGRGLPGEAETRTARAEGWLSVEPAPGLPPGLSVPSNLTRADVDVVLLARHRGAHLITDDDPARHFAEGLGIHPGLSVDILLISKARGLIPSCKEVLDRMAAGGYGVKPAVVTRVLQAAGELN